MKKIAALAGAGAMLLAMAGPALGGLDWFGGSSSLTVRNSALVINKTETEAETGDNETGGGGFIWTGNAYASALVGNDVNNTFVAGCDCYDDVTVRNSAFVYNNTETEAETGDNETGGGRRHRRGGGGVIFTGNAGATSVVTSFVNWTSVGI
jgi:hypothetical protein